MMRYLLIVLVGLTVVACDREAQPEAAAPVSAEPSASEDVKPYPLTVCIVSDEKLGSMGEPVVLVHEGQQVKFCCEGCVGDFKKAPAKYLAKLSAPAASVQ